MSRETDAGWDEDIKLDTEEECAKFGTVRHIFVDKNSQGFVYIKFADDAAAVAAQKALHQRYFGGRTVSAEFQFLKVYDNYFKVVPS